MTRERRTYRTVRYALSPRTVERLQMLSKAWGLPKGRVIDRLVAEMVDETDRSLSVRLERVIRELGLLQAELDLEEDRSDPGEWPLS